jgi:hypothetical protein
MCPVQLDHPWQCWKDLRLAEDLNLCEPIARGAFPPFSNPPTPHPPPNTHPQPSSNILINNITTHCQWQSPSWLVSV